MLDLMRGLREFAFQFPVKVARLWICVLLRHWRPQEKNEEQGLHTNAGGNTFYATL